MSELVAVLVAAGRGRRMGGDKLWLDFWGRPAWRWSLDRLLAIPMVTRVAVVVPDGEIERFRGRLPAGGREQCLVVAGGDRRTDSVLLGLQALAEAGVLPEVVTLVHDAARPAASAALVTAVLEAAVASGAAVPVLPVADTLTRVNEGWIEGTVAREELGAAQTPQAARLGDLITALESARAAGLEPTDEAGALSAAGIPVRAVPGDPANRKLTEAADLPVIRAVLRDQAMVGMTGPSGGAERRSWRTGLGFDAHRLAQGIPLRLGGLPFPDEPRGLVGHSDGDAALHALIDGLLGAVHLGDLGALFPPDEAWRGADSGEMLRETVARAAAAAARPISADLTIVAARPAIGSVRAAMETRIASLLGIEPGRVSVKGTTSDGLGFGGEEGIAAYALVTIERDPA
ncbi:MAG: 2-C-methyl-D-erythritol 4-phosphate cytidylyltransferase [Chloroflexota bacterium]|nr:2-C-methyl-D-erythritol 4-phosphate cytidylyltransferase [Chloroflexota bacterium]